MSLLLAAVALWFGSGDLATDRSETSVELIAHRGESADAPENTMAAFRLAWERDVEAIEVDVHLTADGRLIAIHDADTERTAGVKKVVKSSTLEELQALDVGRWKAPRFAGERMPTLEEVLASIPEGARCFIEVKVGPEAVPALVEAVRSSGKQPEQFVVIAFNADTIAEAKRRLPELQMYYLSSFRQNKETGAWSPTVEDLIEKAQAIGADGLDLSFKGPIDRAFVERVKAAGLGFYVWTIDELDDARRFVEMGVDGITTNRAEWLRKHLAGD